jgi:integrase
MALDRRLVPLWGIRCPSELLPLTWNDVNWERDRFLVHSPKTEHYEGGAERWMPIFPELRPYLEDTLSKPSREPCIL